MSIPAARRQAGFTLLEVLVALAILSFAVVVSIQAFAGGAIPWVLVLSMIFGSLPFVLYVEALRGRWRRLLLDAQLHGFLGILAAFAFAGFLWLWLARGEGAQRAQQRDKRAEGRVRPVLPRQPVREPGRLAIGLCALVGTPPGAHRLGFSEDRRAHENPERGRHIRRIRKQAQPRQQVLHAGIIGGRRSCADIDGNLYITRYGKGTVAVLSPKGEIVREIDILGKQPSNLCFGGPDGKTVYVTEVEHQRLVSFRVDRPGLAWQRWQSK